MPKTITPTELSARLAAGERIVLIDVRQNDEHQFARIPGSVLIPLAELPSRLDEIDSVEGAALVVYCHHGVRSLRGAAILEAAGRSPVYSLSGGIEAWSLFIDPSIPRY